MERIISDSYQYQNRLSGWLIMPSRVAENIVTRTNRNERTKEPFKTKAWQTNPNMIVHISYICFILFLTYY